jgi:hypothetical protein
MWRTGEIFKAVYAKLIVTAQPFIAGLATNVTHPTKLCHSVNLFRHIIYKSKSFIHYTGIQLGHIYASFHESISITKTVTHVPGLFCYLCYRFIPHRVEK